MDRRFLAVTAVLILAGVALAFAFAFIVSGENGRTEDIWLVQNPLQSKTSDPPVGTGSDLLQPVMKNDTVPRPVETNNFTNASKTTIKLSTVAYNETAIMLSTGGKMEIIVIDRSNPEQDTTMLSSDQRKQAEKIALADSHVQDIIGAGMYIEDIQPLDITGAEDSKDFPANGTYASITFTLVNTTTAENESAFFVHVDLDNGHVIRISPLFPQS